MADLKSTIVNGKLRVTSDANVSGNINEGGTDLASKYALKTEISDATITVNQGGVTKGTFTLNGSSATINLTDTNTTYTLSGNNTNTITLTPSSGTASTVTVNNVAHATSASTATTATNATQLGGVAAASYALKSEVPTVPTNISAFTNDKGYITSSAITKSAVTTALGYTPVKSVNGTLPDANGDITIQAGSSEPLLSTDATSVTTRLEWETKTGTGLSNPIGRNVGTDTENIYYSYDSQAYVLNKSTSAGSTKTGESASGFRGENIGTDGEFIYYSNKESNRGTVAEAMLNPGTNIGMRNPYGYNTNSLQGYDVGTDGSNIYCSLGGVNTQYVLDNNNKTGSQKTFSGNAAPYGGNIGSDGNNIYATYGNSSYILDVSTSTGSSKTFTGTVTPSNPIRGQYIGTDGNSIYYSNGTDQYVLNKSTSTWSTKTWSGLTNFTGDNIGTDGDNIYYSNTSDQYVLKKSKVSL